MNSNAVNNYCVKRNEEKGPEYGETERNGTTERTENVRAKNKKKVFCIRKNETVPFGRRNWLKGKERKEEKARRKKRPNSIESDDNGAKVSRKGR